ncbi:MAG TPA: metal ABC transporter substrate-binding protein [Oligoflexus sp.]|uniref:metal ABC transporter substrate-binding protein n=1 Tax=Oligoflexus sp. TaxID=1971216 RepID=UPI002D588028|nr:metal ABC transporter substrate-binding protein [Oligoflexus sp.]HYX36989.1 metal ABC transporter substrate-binding protein [Oligoflexus sp.]
MISKKILLGLVGSFWWSVSAWAADRIKVITTLPDLAWMVQEIGGEFVDAKALLRGSENPHFVDAVPDFIRQVADAKVVCIAGLDLEVGYMPAILAKSGNAAVQPSGPGYCELGRSVTPLDKPTGPINRSMGDVHPMGNPHYFLSPSRLAEASQEAVKALSRVDPTHAAHYEKAGTTFKSRMEGLSQEIKARLEPFRAAQKGQPILIEYHKEYAYFLAEYGILSFGSIEEKPGVPPSAGRLAEIGGSAKNAGVKVALGAEYNPSKTLQRFQEISGITTVIVPTMIQSKGPVTSYAALQKHIADALLHALQAKAK